MKPHPPPERIQPAATDDMREDDSLLPVVPDVRSFVTAINTRLRPPYGDADGRAGTQQRSHRRAATVAAAAGTAAVLFAIVQLAHVIPGALPLWTEVVAVVLTSLAVILGLMLSFHEKWHLERHKAERLRLLKFRALVTPAAWSRGTTPVTGPTFESDAQSLENLKSSDLKTWLQHQAVEEPPDVPGANAFKPDQIRDLVNYYRRTRLGCQINFFARRTVDLQKGGRVMTFLPSWLFFGSLIAALCHFALDLFGVAHEGAGFSLLLILFSAALPVVAAGLRTYRSTYEHNRNAMRYRAIHTALMHLYRALETEVANTAPNYRRIFHDLWWSETLLEFEHREWLRLMTHADWY